jgi:PmbA protein
MSLEDICSFAVREAEKKGAEYAEAYAIRNKEYEVFMENNDLNQAKSDTTERLGIRVFLKRSVGFSSVNIMLRDHIIKAIIRAIKIAKVTPADKFNVMPVKKNKVKLLKGIYDKNAESFGSAEARTRAADLLHAARSYDRRVSVDSGNFASSVISRSILNSNGVRAKESITSFSWSIMGMAIDGKEVSNFDFQFGGSHNIKDIDVLHTGEEFAEIVINSLRSKKIDSFKGETLLSPLAAAELIQNTITYSVNSTSIQKKASKFEGKVGSVVSSDLLTLEDDATNIKGLEASSFDREGLPHQRNLIIDRGILKKFIYNSYTANKDSTKSTANAGGPPTSSPIVSTTNIIVNPGKSKLENLISEIGKGLIINRFSGNVNPVNGDFSGVVKAGQYVRNGNIQFALKEVMVSGNVFDALHRITGISKERKLLQDSLLPSIRIDNISFTAG